MADLYFYEAQDMLGRWWPRTSCTKPEIGEGGRMKVKDGYRPRVRQVHVVPDHLRHLPLMDLQSELVPAQLPAVVEDDPAVMAYLDQFLDTQACSDFDLDPEPHPQSIANGNAMRPKRKHLIGEIYRLQIVRDRLVEAVEHLRGKT